jgi:hypothetical protein
MGRQNGKFLGLFVKSKEAPDAGGSYFVNNSSLRKGFQF